MGHDPDIKLPHVPGHELAGVVAAVGPDTTRWRVGDRVTVPFALGCGGCEQCLSGNQQICDFYFQPGFTAWGSFAEFVALPHADVNLVRLPETLEYVAAASLGCRFVTAYRALVQQGQLTTGRWLAVHGCGGVGLAAIMIAHAMGALPIAVDVREEVLECARELGAVHLLSAGRVGDVPGAIRELTGGGAHVSIDALGSIDTCRNSVRCLRKQGRHVQVGLMLGSDREAAIPMDLVIARELQILGSHGLAAHAYDPLLHMIQAGRLQPGRLVHTRIGLEEAPQALVGMGTFQALGVTVIDRF
jgi:alcohol dehydrogenase